MNKVIHKRKSKLWSKLSNFFIGIKGFKKLDTNYILGDNDIEKELKTFQEKYITKKASNFSKVGQKDKEKIIIPPCNLVILSKDYDKFSLKERAFKTITEGSSNQVEELEQLFKEDPDLNAFEMQNKNSFFNTPLFNGKTLLYTACLEGKAEIVRFLLAKGLDPTVSSKIDANENENCLDVAIRWNFRNIIKILLESGRFNEKEIKKSLDRRNIKKEIRTLLKDNLKTMKGGKACNCF